MMARLLISFMCAVCGGVCMATCCGGLIDMDSFPFHFDFFVFGESDGNRGRDGGGG